MDTYASSAGDPNGFYNISALAPAVNAFFVMAYQLNLQSGASSVSPLTSTAFSEKTAIGQYTAIVPASKVLLGLPYFGIDWPTSDGTLTAQATGPATTLSYGQVLASGHPIYWDATTQTGWTSYEVGTQWHETFFEVPASLYDAAQLASSSGLGGMGIWALGMDGNDPAMTAAISGFSPAVKDYSAGPTTTSTSSTSTTLPPRLRHLPPTPHRPRRRRRRRRHPPRQLLRQRQPHPRESVDRLRLRHRPQCQARTSTTSTTSTSTSSTSTSSTSSTHNDHASREATSLFLDVDNIRSHDRWVCVVVGD